jgi:hypothetical protein
MSLESRIEKLEAGCSQRTWDFTEFTDDELLTLNACYDEQGNIAMERITPELEALLRRAER